MFSDWESGCTAAYADEQRMLLNRHGISNADVTLAMDVGGPGALSAGLRFATSAIEDLNGNYAVFISLIPDGYIRLSAAQLQAHFIRNGITPPESRGFKSSVFRAAKVAKVIANAYWALAVEQEELVLERTGSAAEPIPA